MPFAEFQLFIWVKSRHRTTLIMSQISVFFWFFFKLSLVLDFCGRVPAAFKAVNLWSPFTVKFTWQLGGRLNRCPGASISLRASLWCSWIQWLYYRLLRALPVNRSIVVASGSSSRAFLESKRERRLVEISRPVWRVGRCNSCKANQIVSRPSGRLSMWPGWTRRAGTILRDDALAASITILIIC